MKFNLDSIYLAVLISSASNFKSFAFSRPNGNLKNQNLSDENLSIEANLLLLHQLYLLSTFQDFKFQILDQIIPKSLDLLY